MMKCSILSIRFHLKCRCQYLNHSQLKWINHTQVHLYLSLSLSITIYNSKFDSCLIHSFEYSTFNNRYPIYLFFSVHVPYPVPKPYEVIKKIPYTVEKPVPYEVKVPIDKPFPVYKEVKFPVVKEVPTPIKEVVPFHISAPHHEEHHHVDHGHHFDEHQHQQQYHHHGY